MKNQAPCQITCCLTLIAAVLPHMRMLTHRSTRMGHPILVWDIVLSNTRMGRPIRIWVSNMSIYTWLNDCV